MLPCFSNQSSLGSLALPHSVPNFHEISDQNQLRLYENAALQENSLIRLDIPRIHIFSSNIFRAVSFSLYMTTIYESFLQNLCVQAVRNLLSQKLESIPKKLRIFMNNQQLFTDYCQDTTNPKFNMLTFEIVSMIFQAKVVIYEIDDNQYLHSTILNNAHDFQMLLFRDRLGHFDHVETISFTLKFQSLKTIVLDIITSCCKLSESKKHRRDSDKFFEELNRDIENEINPPATADKKGRTLVFSSSSIDLLDNTTIDQTAEKQKYDQFFFNGSQAEVNNGVRSAMARMKTSREKSDLWTPKIPNGQEKITEQNEDDAFAEQQKFFPHPNDPQNPFQIDTRSGFSQNESPKFVASETNPLISTCFRQKKNKNIALKCTSEEFIIPLIKPTDFTKKPISPQPYPFKKQPLVLEESREKYLGTLKFFDEVKGYGFIIMDVDNSEIFVHFDDFIKAQGIQREMLMTYKLGNIIRVSFNCMKYIGKYNMSRKAVDVQVLSTSF